MLTKLQTGGGSEGEAFPSQDHHQHHLHDKYCYPHHIDGNHHTAENCGIGLSEKSKKISE